MVNSRGEKMFQNQRTSELLKIPLAFAAMKDDTAQLRHVTNSMVDPAKFAERVAYYYSHPEESGLDEIHLKDGTILERTTAPVVDKEGRNYGRIWTFRDATERKTI